MWCGLYGFWCVVFVGFGVWYLWVLVCGVVFMGVGVWCGLRGCWCVVCSLWVLVCGAVFMGVGVVRSLCVLLRGVGCLIFPVHARISVEEWTIQRTTSILQGLGSVHSGTAS